MKKKHNLFMKLLTIMFVVFLGLYIASVSGFYEAKVGDKVALTEEAIKQFEQDIIDGKVVDVNTYITNDYKDYSNGFTEAGEKISSAVETIVTDGFGGIWDAIQVLFF